jgi:ABC-type dipeptide/oligopeptide/nickel transport system permease component
MPSSAELRARFDAVEGTVEQVEKTAEAYKKKDRSRIAQTVVSLYAGVVAACFAFVIVIFVIGTYWKTLCGTPPAAGCVPWQEPAEFLLKVLTTAVLPIVTLVLGYYFGTAKAEEEEE